MVYWLDSAYRRNLRKAKIEAWALWRAGPNLEADALLIQAVEEDFEVEVLAA